MTAESNFDSYSQQLTLAGDTHGLCARRDAPTLNGVVTSDAPLPSCTQPLKPLCQQQEPSWTPMSLPTPTSRKLFYKLQISSEIAVTVYLRCLRCVTRRALASEHLTWLSESQPNFSWWCLRAGWSPGKLG